MILNPENVFESLQNDVAAKLLDTSPFNSIKAPDGTPFNVLTEDEGDPEFEYRANIDQLGLCVVVKAASAKGINPDLAGPLVTAFFDVWASEAVIFNRSVGTQVRAMKAAKIIMETLHGFVPPTTNINAPIQYIGFDVERQRTYMNDQDKIGTLVVSRICHFNVPLVQA